MEAFAKAVGVSFSGVSFSRIVAWPLQLLDCDMRRAVAGKCGRCLVGGCRHAWEGSVCTHERAYSWQQGWVSTCRSLEPWPYAC